MTFAMNIKKKYRIPVTLNNKKLLQRKKTPLKGILQAVPITRNITKIPVTVKNTKK